MTLRISYFAWVRERMGVAGEAVALPAGAATVGDLIGWLAARDERGAYAFKEPQRIRAAVGGSMVGVDAPIGDATEIALFPPVTGG
jgi:molybdopterin synthase sulfur carrier subunit